MKAAVYARSGSSDVVQITDVEKPAPKDNEVLIRVRAASVNPADYHLMKGGQLFFRLVLALIRLVLRAPKMERRPGVDVAGLVEAVGRGVTQFKPGDEVFGACRGAFAEYACTSESAFVTKPANVTFEQAASAPVAALTALQGLRDKAHIRPGQKVLINGAAGGVGTFAVQMAKSFGAEVTGVCSTRNVETVRSLGADRVVDYTQEDFTQSEPRYDVLFDLVANHSLSACRRVLTPKGTYLGAGVLAIRSVTGILARMITARVLSVFTSQNFVTFIAKLNKEDLTLVSDLMAARKVTAVIDRRYPLSEAAEALRYLAERHARGKVVIILESIDN